MKRGQILGQVFILILASIVFILILLYGYRAISQFTHRSEQVALIDFENDFKNAVKGISLDFGSVKRLDVNVPSRHRQLCVFCTPLAGYPGCNLGPGFQNFRVEHPLLVESWEGGSQNVFLLPLADTPLLIDRVEVINSSFCTKVVQGKVSLRLEGKGDRALVSVWPVG